MKRTLHLLICFAAALLITLSPSSALLAGTIYVDDGNAVYSKLATAASNVSPTVFSSVPGNSVVGMAFGPSGTLFGAAENGGTGGEGAIIQYSRSGAESVFYQTSGFTPIGLAIDSSGDIFTGAEDGAEIEEFTNGNPDANPILTGPLGALFVESLAFDTAGDLFEGDSTGNVYEFPAGAGTPKTVLSLAGPVFGLAFDRAGDLFATYQSGPTSGGIVELTPGGTQTTLATFGVAPTSLAYDPQTGNLYMGEVKNVAESNPGTSNVLELSTTDSSPGNPSLEEVFESNLDSPYAIADQTPEPGSLLLLFSGIISISLVYWRRRARQ